MIVCMREEIQMNVNQIGAMPRAYDSTDGSKAQPYEASATAADFAALIKKLAGPEMLWKEQPAEALAAEGERDYTGVMGDLMAVRENKK